LPPRLAWARRIRRGKRQLPAARRPASDEGEVALKTFKVPEGLKMELVAAEPLLANPLPFHR
jgi:hypothetical protein